MGEAVARWWPLLIVTAGGLGLLVAGVLPSWPGSVHLVAVPPLDLAVDLRLMTARATSYPMFLIGLGVSVVVRTLVLASLLRTIGATPTWGSGLARASRLYAMALVPMAVTGGLEFAGLAAVYALYAWVGVGITLFAFLVIAPRVIPPRGARLLRVPTLAGYVAALAAVGALADLGGRWTAGVGLLLSGALTAVTMDRLVRPRLRRRRAPVAASLLVAASVILPPGTGAAGQVEPNTVLLIVPGVDTSSGFGAAYRLDPGAIGFPCDRVYYFSYRGPGVGTPPGEAPCPIRLHRPYARTATQRPLPDLVAAFADQVTAIRAATDDAPMVVVTHSQGAVIAWRAVAQGRAVGISHVVGLAGFPHSPVGYPLPGEDGSGRIGADALRMVSWISRFLAFGAFDPDAPLAREILARPDGLELIFGEPLPAGTSAAMLFATADLVVAPEGRGLPHGTTVTVDTTHVGMVSSPDAEEIVGAVLAGRMPDGGTPLAAVLAPLLPAWLPPPE